MPIDWLAIGAAWLAGLLGSAHCAAMCGGIATGFSIAAPRGRWAAVEANGGRVAGYAIAGAIAGGVGHGIVDLVRLPWLAIGLRMLLGIVLVAVAIRLLDRGHRFGFLTRPGVVVWRWLGPLHRRLLPANSSPRRLALGLLWGWMPCGLSSTLLIAAWLQATALNGALTMAAFGIGTLPVMLPLSWSGARMGRWLEQPRRRRAAAALVLFSGLLTMTAPWLMRVPALHGVLGAAGCVSVATGHG